MASASTLWETVLGAFQGSVSVLLTLTAGYACARLSLIDHAATKKVSNLASLVFLPCLLVVQMGPQLNMSMLSAVWIIPLWGIVSTALGHGIGWLGKVGHTIIGVFACAKGAVVHSVHSSCPTGRSLRPAARTHQPCRSCSSRA